MHLSLGMSRFANAYAVAPAPVRLSVNSCHADITHASDAEITRMVRAYSECMDPGQRVNRNQGSLLMASCVARGLHNDLMIMIAWVGSNS